MSQNDKPKTKKPEDQDVCANLDCRKPCDDGDFFVCDECSGDTDVLGHGHDVMEHWDPLL